MRPVQAVNARTYYPHVEGLRGVAAFYVFLFHIWQYGVSHAGATLTVLLPYTLPWLQFGHFAVSAFIVISGYCLGLPVAQRLDAPFNKARFAKRRARRLLPAYTLALFLSVIPFCIMAVLLGRHPNMTHIAIAIVTHLALIHNWIPSLAEYLNGPMWSIALECQIYVVFALLLIPVWKRFGPWAQLAVALVIGLAPHFLFHGRFDYTIWWLLALFGMGVLAAHITARSPVRAPYWRLIALLVAAIAVVFVMRTGDATPDSGLWPADIVVGAAIALMFVTSDGERLTWTGRFLSLRPVVIVGTFSYSLYLIHGPLVAMTAAALQHIHAGVMISSATYLGLIVVVLAGAYGFFLIAERPFLSAGFREAIERSPDHERLFVPDPDGSTASQGTTA
ncbi:MAG TPA: acyltransferase [Candidatus Tumulicola sp.]